MHIKFIDFVPKILVEGGFFQIQKYEEFETTLKRLNEWKDENNNLEIINIETIVLPNIYSSREDGSTDVDLRTGGESSSNWHQIIRVWYKVKNDI